MKNNVLKFSVLLVLSACGAKHSDDSDLQHTLDQPVRSKLSSNWLNADDASYLKIMNVMMPLNKASVVSKDDPATKKVQMWVDQIDANLRSRYAGDLSQVPKPIVKILASKDVNAFIASAPICFRKSLMFVPNSELRGLPVAALFDKTNLAILPMSGNCIELANEKLEDEFLTDYAKTLAEGKAPCSLKLNKDSQGKIQSAELQGQFCMMYRSFQGLNGAAEFSVMATLPYVNVFSGTLTQLSEKEVVSVLAHELGHYYRSHGTHIRGQYQYFYKLGEQNTSEKPVADASLNSIGKQIAKSGLLATQFARTFEVSDQRYSSLIYPLVGELAYGLCKDSRSCSDACKEFRSAVDTEEFAKTMKAFPFVKLTSTEQFKLFEDKAQACLESAKVANSRDVDRMWKQVIDTVYGPTWPKVARTSPESKALYQKYDRLGEAVGEELPDQYPGQGVDPKDFNEILATLSKVLDAKKQSINKVFLQAKEQKVAYYTTEQEADEISLEWLTQIGVEPATASDVFMRFGQMAAARQTSQPKTLPGDFTWAECEALRAKNWKDTDGKYIYLSVGDFMDPHHSACYRAFNVEREIAIHKYRVAQPTSQLDASNWTSIQKGMTEFQNQAPLVDRPQQPKRKRQTLEVASDASSAAAEMGLNFDSGFGAGCLFSPAHAE